MDKVSSGTRVEGIKEAANRVKVMGGYYGLDEKQTDDLTDEVIGLIPVEHSHPVSTSGEEVKRPGSYAYRVLEKGERFFAEDEGNAYFDSLESQLRAEKKRVRELESALNQVCSRCSHLQSVQAALSSAASGKDGE